MTMEKTEEKELSVREDTEEDAQVSSKKYCRNVCQVHSWRKYLWEGQTLSKTQTRALEKLSDDAPLLKRILVKHRRLVGFLVPALVFHFCWWSIMIKKNLWHLFVEKYFMSITMVFGSIIAGMTSEGGGAVAFPVMTLAFNIAPSVARDFSLMIQSCGMSAAAFTIFFMRIQLEYHALLFCSFGGLIGIIFGFHVVDPALTPPQKKMIFVSVFFAFASVLFLINRYHKRRTFSKIQNFNAWKAVFLTVVGICGGIFSSFSGSGLDICCFSILTLFFRISEKIATPLSVILMAGNSLVGFFWRQVIISEVSADAWEYFAVCVPVVVFGAPFGSLVGSHFHRLVLATIVCLLDIIALISAWAIIDLTTPLIIMSIGISLAGFIMFCIFAQIGQMLLRRISEEEEGSVSGTEEENQLEQEVNRTRLDEDCLIKVGLCTENDTQGSESQHCNGSLMHNGHVV